MSERRTGPKLDETTTRLSLAVKLVDGFTGDDPVGAGTVRLEGVDATPVRNRSGYLVFLDLQSGTVTVDVDGGPRYLDASSEGVEVVDLTEPDADVDPTDPSTLPVETVELTPSPAYEFPAGTTLIRGAVRDSGGEAVAGAEVSIRDADPLTTTDDAGEFVLFFRALTGEDVSVVDGRRLVEVDGSTPVVEASHPDHGTTSEAVEVEEGALTVLDLAFP